MSAYSPLLHLAGVSSFCVKYRRIADIRNDRLIYRFMKRRIHQLEDLPEETTRRAANTVDDLEEGAPLLRDFSTESVDNGRSIQANGGSP